METSAKPWRTLRTAYPEGLLVVTSWRSLQGVLVLLLAIMKAPCSQRVQAKRRPLLKNLIGRRAAVRGQPLSVVLQVRAVEEVVRVPVSTKRSEGGASLSVYQQTVAIVQMPIKASIHG